MQFDILPYANALGQHNRIQNGPMNAGETFTRHTPVFVNADGEVAGFPADGTEAILADLSGDGLVLGIAVNGPGDGLDDPSTGLAYATGANIGYVLCGAGQYFATNNIYNAGAAGQLTGAMVGNLYEVVAVQLDGVNWRWGIDLGAAGTPATDVLARVVKVLNTFGQEVSATDTTTGVTAVIELMTHITP